MAYRKEVEMAIKGFLTKVGFKRKPKTYKFTRLLTDDISQDIGFAYETHGRFNYYFMRTTVGICSHSLNNILFEVTDGKIDHRSIGIGPVYLSRSKYYTGKPYSDMDYIHCEFFADLSMDDNLADFERMYINDVQVVFNSFLTQKSIYTCSAHEERFPFNPSNIASGFFYGPLGYFFDGQFSKAIKYAEERIKIAETTVLSCKGIVSAYEEARNELMAYKAYLRNLKKWIAEQRQFSVDGEFLPRYD